MTTHRKRGHTGFTLLEVLAAVAILGLWFSILATVGIQGLRAEGTNERRIRASLLADSELANLEIQLADGLFPEEDEEESEQDEFTIVMTRTLLSEADVEQSEVSLVELLTDEAENLTTALYLIRVEVTWIEGFDEEHVVRTTYAWDSTEFNDWLEKTTGGAEEEGPGGAEGSGQEGGQGQEGSGNSREKYKKKK